MTEAPRLSSGWQVASDASEVHALLCACDSHTATPCAPAPQRNVHSTELRVRSGAVHLLRDQSEAVAMFTLTWDPPFALDGIGYPTARKPAYLCRLAVRPDWLAKGSVIGAQCIRKAIELASSGGADVLRSEANPDLTGVSKLLTLFGFIEYDRAQSDDGRRRVYLQKQLHSTHD